FTGVESPTIVTTLTTPNASRKADDYFAQGFLEVGVGLNYELRVILASSWDEGTQRLTLTLNAALEKTIVGDQVQLIPGCDGTAATCISKFDNYLNYFAFLFVPIQNPTISSTQNDVASGGKK
ncbi:MAG: hypothetical protein JWM68_372, partial [Verrucomicrobiales bacterium]|nr:hypothetical protein [Verrucomicrobiales bacterium]